MYRRSKIIRNNIADSAETQENGSNVNTKLKVNTSFTIINNQKVIERQNKTPNSIRNRIAIQLDSKALKKPQKDILFDNERLIEENIAYKLQVSENEEENLKLKERLFQLLKEQDQDSSTKIPKLKKKIRDLQQKSFAVEEELFKLKENIKPCK